MLRYLSALSLLIASVSLAATTYTPHYDLAKPSDGSTSWGPDIRDNFDAIDTQMYTSETGLADHIAGTVGAHMATAIQTVPGSLTCISSINVQQFLDCLDSNFGSIIGGNVVTTNTAQTIASQKTFSSTILANSGVTLAGNLTLTGSTNGILHAFGDLVSSSKIVDFDVDAAAAIARTKLSNGSASHVLINTAGGIMSSEATLSPARGGTGTSSLGTANQILGVNNAATSGEYKTISGTTNRVIVTHGVGTITLSAPQDIAVSSSPTFNGLKLEDPGAGTNTATIQSPTLGSSYTLTLPVDDGTTNQFLQTNGTGTLTWADGSVADGAITTIKLATAAVTRTKIDLTTFIQPTIQRLTSGSGTYTTPASVQYIKIRLVGGGGGGGGGASSVSAVTAGGNGGNTTFGSSLLTANGGTGGAASSGAGGTGGTTTINSPAISLLSLSGGNGQAGVDGSPTRATGGSGASSPFGGAGVAIGNNSASAAAASVNSGSGGGGGGTNSGTSQAGGNGGGAGGYIEAIIVGPSSSYAYSIGTAGTAGSAGASGYAGSAGGSGQIIVEEYYQ